MVNLPYQIPPKVYDLPLDIQYGIKENIAGRVLVESSSEEIKGFLNQFSVVDVILMHLNPFSDVLPGYKVARRVLGNREKKSLHK